MQNIVIIGASGHGSVVLDCLLKQGKYNVLGFLDSYKKKGTKINGYTILGTEYDLPAIKEKHHLLGGIVAIGDNWIRKMVVDRILRIAPDFCFVTVVHPNATIGLDVEIGKGSVIMPGVAINANSVVGEHCILNTKSSLGHDGFMNDFTSLAPNVCIGGNFILGEGSVVCLGVNIIENITVGRHSVIGAGALVVGNIEHHVIAYGVPAKKVRSRAAGEPYLAGSRNNTSKLIPFVPDQM